MSDNVPDGWTQSKLGKVAKLTMGQSPSSETYNAEGIGLPFFQGKADFGARSPKVRYWCSEPTKVASKSSILFSVRAPVGEVNVTPYECCIGRGLAGIHGDIANQEFLFQKLQYIKPRFQLLSQGSTFEAVNGSDLKDFSLTLPPLPEQQKIATILSSVDNVIETTRAQIDKLKHLKTGMMQELLTKGIGHTEFKDSPVGRIPTEWDVCDLKSVCSSKYGIVDGPFGSNLKTEHYRPSGIPVFQSGLVTSNRFIKRDYVYVDQAKFEEQKRSSAKAGDILMAKIGMRAGACAIIPKNHPVGILAGNSLKMSVDPDKASTDYILGILHLMQSTGEIRRLLTETAQPAVSITTLKKMKVALPPLEEQKLMAETLGALDKKLLIVMDKLETLSRLKKALMQDLLTGKIRVKIDEKEKEPAVA